MTTPKKTRFMVRPAEASDLSACLALDHSQETQDVWQMGRQETESGFQVHFNTLRLPRPIKVEYPRNTEDLRLDLGILDGVLVAEAEGIILGYAQVTVSTADRNAWLRNLVVDAPWRGHRIGRALLDQARVRARLGQATHLTAEATTRSYPAIRFLMGQGLLFCGFNDRYYLTQDIAVFFGQNL